jgi:hypothetical protein
VPAGLPGAISIGEAFVSWTTDGEENVVVTPALFVTTMRYA